MKILVGFNQNIKDINFFKQYLNSYYPEVLFATVRALPDYLDIANKVAVEEFTKAIIITNNAVEVFLVANKVKNCRAAPLLDEYTAAFCVKHNNTNIAIIPLDIISQDYAVKLINIFLTAKFEGNRHAQRLAMLDKLS